MDLIQLIEKLVADPKELAAFKAEREAYIARQDPSLWPHLRSLLQQHNVTETGTVMRLKSRSLLTDGAPDHAATPEAPRCQPGQICLDGALVILRTDVPFFAEHLATAPEPWPGYPCTLLNHSFAHAVQYGSNWVVHFTLNLSFVDPANRSDRPQILTLLSGDPNYEPPTYNLGNTSVMLYIQPQSYILLRGAHDFCVYLGKGSYYDPSTDEIVLYLDDPTVSPS